MAKVSSKPFFKPKLITAEAFEKFDPDWRYDLIRDELCPMLPMAGFEHGMITNRLATRVSVFVETNDLGECTAAETRFQIEQNPDTIIGSDFAFVSKERMPLPIPKGFLPIAPDWVLEVRSPSDRKKEVETKVALWLSAGVRLLWELNLKTRILSVYRPGKETYMLGIEDVLTGEDILPGFELPLKQLFRD